MRLLSSRLALRFVTALALGVVSVPVLGSPAEAAGLAPCDPLASVATIADFDQNTKEDTTGGWTNGNLNRSNSSYAEGDWVPQRLSLSGVAAGRHYVDVEYDILKNGTYAYDRLRFAEIGQAAGVAPVGITEYGRPSDAALATAVANGQTVSVRARLVFDYGGAATSVAFRFDSHVSSEIERRSPAASSISGSPYHVALVAMDCSTTGVGGRDNQLQADAVRGGFLGVVKDVAGETNAAENFSFTISNGDVTQNFTLDENSDAAYSDRFGPYFAAPGPWTITENAPGSAFRLQDITCTGPGAVASKDLATRTVVVNVPDQSKGQDKTPTVCTFVNARYQDATGSVTTTPSFRRTYDWTLDKEVLGDDTQYVTFDADGNPVMPTFEYGLTAKRSKAKDSGYTVTGSATLTNPNSVPLSSASVGVTAGPAGTGTTCDVTGPTSVPASSDRTYDYTCTGVGAADGTVVATASYTVGGTPKSTQLGTKAYSFAGVTPTVTDATATATDLTVGGGGQPITDGETIEYTWTLPPTAVPEAGTCEPPAADAWRNRAELVESDSGTTRDASATVTVCRGADLTATKDGRPTLSRTYLWDVTKTVTDPDAEDRVVVDPVTGTADVDYEVAVRATGTTDSSWELTGDVEVTNPNAWPVDVTVTDLPQITDLTLAEACTVDGPASVPARGSTTYEYSCSFTSDVDQPAYDDGDKNVATVTWDPATAHTPGQEATAVFPVPAASWQVTAENNRFVTVGDLFDGGTEQLVTAPGTTLDWLTVVLMPGQQQTFDVTRTVTVPDEQAGTCRTGDDDVDNTATVRDAEDGSLLDDDTVSIDACRAAPVSLGKTVQPDFDRTYSWDVKKEVDQASRTIDTGTADVEYTVSVKPVGYIDDGYRATGTVSVGNANDWRGIVVELTEEPSAGTCTFDDTETPTTSVTLGELGSDTASATRDFTCDFGDTKPEDGTTNTVLAVVQGAPALGATVSEPVELADTTDHETDETVSVSDLADAPYDTARDLGSVTWSKDTEGTWVALKSYTLAWGGTAGTCVDHQNTATLTTNDTGTQDTAEQSVEVCRTTGLDVEKTVDASYDRDFGWKVDKTVADDERTVAAGGTAGFDYTLTLSPDGYDDTGWEMSGLITVGNPSDYDTARDVVISDVPGVGVGATCLVDGEATQTRTIAPGGDVTLPYACSFTEGFEPGDAPVNTAKAVWQDEDYTDARAVDFTLDQEVDRTVTATDDHATGTFVDVEGALDWYDVTATPRTGVLTYTDEHTAAPGTCEEYTNRGGVAELEQYDAVTVTSCTQRPLAVETALDGSFTRTYLWDVDKTPGSGVPGDEDATMVFDYAVDVSQAGTQATTPELGGVVTVTNPNTASSLAITPTQVLEAADLTGGAASCTVTEPEGGYPPIPAGGSTTYPVTCAAENEPTGGTAVATVSWPHPEGGAPRSAGSDAEADNVSVAVTEVDRTVTATDTPQGQRARTLGTVAWDTDRTGPVTFADTITWTGVAGRCVPRTNVAHVLGDEGDVVATGQAEVQVCISEGLTGSQAGTLGLVRDHDWSIAKTLGEHPTEVRGSQTVPLEYTVTVTEGAYTDGGFTLTGSTTLTNSDQFGSTVVDVAVSTDLPFECTVVDGQDVRLPNEAADGTGTPVTLDYSCTGTGSPSAADGDYSGELVLRVTADGADAGTAPLLTNRQPVTVQVVDKDRTVDVSDSYHGSVADLGELTWSAAGAEHVFPRDGSVEAKAGTCVDDENVASYTSRVGESSLDRPETGSDSAGTTVCAAAPARLSGALAGDVDRAYAWDVAKVADVEEITAVAGTKTPVTWTITVTPGSSTDSGWNASGDLVVDNPNDYRSLALGAVMVDGGEAGTCTADVTGDSVPAGGSVTVPVACTWTEDPAAETVTASLDVDGSTVQKVLAATLGLGDETDATVTVDDPMLDDEPLGTVDWDADGVATRFEGVSTVVSPETDCEVVDNTATLRETGQSATASVDSCAVVVEPPVVTPPVVTPPVVTPPVVTPPVVTPPVVNGPTPPYVVTETPQAGPPPRATSLPSTGAPAGLAQLAWLGGLLVAAGLIVSRRTARTS